MGRAWSPWMSLPGAELQEQTCAHAGDEGVDHDRGEARGGGEPERGDAGVRQLHIVAAGGSPPPEGEQEPEREPGDRSESFLFLEFPGEPCDPTRAGPGVGRRGVEGGPEDVAREERGAEHAPAVSRDADEVGGADLVFSARPRGDAEDQRAEREGEQRRAAPGGEQVPAPTDEAETRAQVFNLAKGPDQVDLAAEVVPVHPEGRAERHTGGGAVVEDAVREDGQRGEGEDERGGRGGEEAEAA